MATTFLEPGGDATFTLNTKTNGGFWASIGGTPSVVTDFVRDTHVKSYKFIGTTDAATTPTGVCSDSGSRVSFYIYINAYPTGDSMFFNTQNKYFQVGITSTGVLKCKNGLGTDIGGTGSTLATGKWYRISMAWTVASTSVNEFRIFKNGTLDISISNASLNTTAASSFVIGNCNFGDTDIRFSDIYADTNNSLADMGDILVIAKRPNANGTANGFTTQIGAGSSGYGTGHSPQVNERALDTTNGWSMVGAGSAVTEEYNIESKSTGDININIYDVVDTVGWAYMSSLVAETVQLIINGTNFAQAITSTNTMYTKVAGSVSYPSGAGADIGITTDTSLTTVSLFECGIIVAVTPRLVSSNLRKNNLRPRAFSPGLAR